MIIQVYYLVAGCDWSAGRDVRVMGSRLIGDGISADVEIRGRTRALRSQRHRAAAADTKASVALLPATIYFLFFNMRRKKGNFIRMFIFLFLGQF